MLGRLAPVPRELALDLRRRRVVEVELVPVGHDVVHDPAHDDVAGVAHQVVGVAVLVLARFEGRGRRPARRTCRRW